LITRVVINVDKKKKAKKKNKLNMNYTEKKIQQKNDNNEPIRIQPSLPFKSQGNSRILPLLF